MVDQTPARIRAMFDQISPRYDFLNHLLSLNSDVLWRRRAAELLAGARRVLDVCSGTGDLAFEIHRRCRARVVGTDFSRRMLEIARLKARRKGLTDRVSFQQADTLRLPFRDAAFDAVAVAFGLRNVVDPDRALAEMTRVARPGGRVLVLEFSLPPSTLLRRAYLVYFSRLLPRVGRWISRSEIDAYRYLPDSVSRWPGPEKLASRFERAGLRDVSFELLFGGVAALHWGRRP